MFENLFRSRGPKAPPIPTLDKPPEKVTWHETRPTGDEQVRAWVAREDCEVVTKHGVLKARKGEDMVVAYGPRDVAVVRKDLFNRTYKRAGKGLFRKRTDVKLRYFTLDHAVMVETLEGPQLAQPGDWIVQGLDGELWPVEKEKAREKYRVH